MSGEAMSTVISGVGVSVLTASILWQVITTIKHGNRLTRIETLLETLLKQNRTSRDMDD